MERKLNSFERRNETDEQCDDVKNRKTEDSIEGTDERDEQFERTDETDEQYEELKIDFDDADKISNEIKIFRFPVEPLILKLFAQFLRQTATFMP